MSTKLPEGFKNVIIGLNEVMYSVPLAVLDEIERLTAKEQHLLDVYKSLGVKWGDDPFVRIDRIAKLEDEWREALEAT